MTHPSEANPGFLYRQHLLVEVQAAFPSRRVRLEPLPPEAFYNLPEAKDDPHLEELVISSDGPGHYAVSLPELDDPHPTFQLFFVNANDMPGDGERLGVFTTATDAVAAAVAHENPTNADLSEADLAEARQAASLAALGFPATHRRDSDSTRGVDLTHRTPYVGADADGARRSAAIDREEADVLDRTDPRHDQLTASAERWEQQAASDRPLRQPPSPTTDRDR